MVVARTDLVDEHTIVVLAFILDRLRVLADQPYHFEARLELFEREALGADGAGDLAALPLEVICDPLKRKDAARSVARRRHRSIGTLHLHWHQRDGTLEVCDPFLQGGGEGRQRERDQCMVCKGEKKRE